MPKKPIDIILEKKDFHKVDYTKKLFNSSKRKIIKEMVFGNSA